jgi:hypothetical protein
LAEGVLGVPDRRTQQILWYIVVWTMVAAIFVFGTMAFVLIYQKKAAEAPLALATTALGGVVGLIATSPGGAADARVERSKLAAPIPAPVALRYKGSGRPGVRCLGAGQGRFDGQQARSRSVTIRTTTCDA